jgi:GNAT superfamily N-acetyltransferase
MKQSLIVFSKIEFLECVTNSILCELTKRAKSGRSQEFLVFADDCEAGLLSFEDWSDQSLGFVYLVFVLPEHRCLGIGEKMIFYAEELARSLGCSRICLEPYSFDRTIESAWLVSWYKRQGYVFTTNDPSRMEKIIAALPI